jgi:large subunit ribosomal protein L24
MHVKKGDNVIVLAGKDKGKKGKVLKVLPKENKVLVEGVNVYKRHQRARRQNEKGQVLDVTRPLQISNVSPVDPKSGKATRVGKKEVSGKRVRIATKSGQEL